MAQHTQDGDKMGLRVPPPCAAPGTAEVTPALATRLAALCLGLRRGPLTSKRGCRKSDIHPCGHPKVKPTPKRVLEPPLPARPEGAPGERAMRFMAVPWEGTQCHHSRASTARPWHGHPRVPTPLCLRVPPAVPPQTAPPPLIPIPTVRPGRCWALAGSENPAGARCWCRIPR